MNTSNKPREPSVVITRREALQGLGAATLLSLGLWPGALRAAGAAPPAGEFTFIEVNDLHHMSPECSVWLERVVAAMKREKPEFVLAVGDLADRGTVVDTEAVKKVFETLGIPVYVQIGNHDYTKEGDRSAYESIFPGRLNYDFVHRGWQFVGVDSTEGPHFESTRINETTLRWVDAHLETWERTRPLVLFTHFPLGDGVKMRPLNADALLEKFLNHNLQAVFNGHFHGFTEHTYKTATITTDRCCALRRDNFDGAKEKGFFVCTARDGRITRRFVEVNPAGILPPPPAQSVAPHRAG